MLNKTARILLLTATATMSLAPINTVALAAIIYQGQGGPAAPGGGGQGQGNPAAPAAGGQGQVGPAAPTGQGAPAAPGGTVQGQTGPAAQNNGQGKPAPGVPNGAPGPGGTIPNGGQPQVGTTPNGAPVKQGPGNPLVLPSTPGQGQGQLPGKPNNPAMQKDASGNIIPLKDANGNIVPGKDANGTVIPARDANGNIIPLRDANGNVVPGKDANGNDINAKNIQKTQQLPIKVIGAPEGMDTLRDSRQVTLGSADNIRSTFFENGMEYFGYSFFAGARSLIDSRRYSPISKGSRPKQVSSQIGSTSDLLNVPKGRNIDNPINQVTGIMLATDTVISKPTNPNDPTQIVTGSEQPRGLDVGTVAQNPTIDPNQSVSASQQSPNSGTNPFQTIIGPADMMSGFAQAPNPDRYQLGPGDQFVLRVWSPTLDATETTIMVDGRGDAILPTGDRIQVRGLSLAQVESVFQKRLVRKIVNVQLTVTLKQLRTISVTLLGESYAPGNYQMPSNVTLYNALYASGGPSALGTLRKITLKRSDGTSRIFDFYSYLRGTDSVQDLVLQPGDVVYIPPVETRVVVKGEIITPAIYELKRGERLRDAIRYSGGVKPSAVSQRVSIESIQPGSARKLIDANLLSASPANNPVLYSGDVVEVLSIRGNLINVVQIDGSIDQPGRYAFTPGLTVSQLIDRARGTLVDTYFDKAHLTRTNIDGTLQLFTLDVRKAMKHDPQNDFKLAPQDKLHIFNLREVQFMNDRAVTVQGAVQRPATYYRSDNMRLLDVILMTGGTRPEAYTDQIFIQRRDEIDRPGELLRINLKKLLAGDTKENVLLNDKDHIRIFTVDEFNVKPRQVVQVTGAVQKPGSFPRATNMMVRDLINLAGNLTVNAYTDVAFLQRKDEADNPGPIIRINVLKAMAGDPKFNIALEDRDTLTILTEEDFNYQSSHRVRIAGAVQKPNTFARSENMRVLDILNMAGNTLPNAYLDMAFLQRMDINEKPGPLIRINVRKLLAGDAKENALLQDRDVFTIYTEDEFNVQSQHQVRIAGAVQKPSTFPRAQNMRVLDLLNLAGNPLVTAYLDTAFIQRTDILGKPGPLIKVNLRKLEAGDVGENIALEDRDVFTVYTVDEFNVQSQHQVHIAGAVQKPGNFVHAENMRVLDLLSLAGNVLPNAYVETAFIQRRDINQKPGEMLRINIRKLLDGDASENVLLQDRDALTIYTMEQFMFQRDQQVTIAGAVQTPGAFARSSNMRIADLVAISGNVLPDANDKAFIQRANPDGTAGPLLIVDLNKAFSGDVKENVLLQDKDAVSVYTKAEAMFKAPQNVQIQGAVLKPGNFQRSENMKLSDLLTLAGGFKPDVSDRIEIAHSRTDRRAVPYVIAINGGPSGMPAENPSIQDGDIVIIKSRGDFIDKPRVVTVHGSVNRPGPVVIHGDRMTVSDIIREAGGLRSDAYPQGSEFMRMPALLETAGQMSTIVAVNKLNDILNQADYGRLSAAAAVAKTRAITSASQNSGANLIPGITPITPTPTGQSAENIGLVKLFETNLVSQPRSIGPSESLITGNVTVNVANALRSPHRSADDMIVMDGDVVTIPSKPTTIQVLGSVIQNRAVPFSQDAKIDYYINQTGGLTIDAARDRILVLRMGGGLIPANKVHQLMAGDIILVPSKVVAGKLDSGKSNVIDNIFKNLTTSTLLILAAKKLLGI